MLSQAVSNSKILSNSLNRSLHIRYHTSDTPISCCQDQIFLTLSSVNGEILFIFSNVSEIFVTHLCQAK